MAKTVYKCDYYTYTGILDKVIEHEKTYFDNYNLKSCSTCKHKKI